MMTTDTRTKYYKRLGLKTPANHNGNSIGVGLGTKTPFPFVVGTPSEALDVQLFLKKPSLSNDNLSQSLSIDPEERLYGITISDSSPEQRTRSKSPSVFLISNSPSPTPGAGNELIGPSQYGIFGSLPNPGPSNLFTSSSIPLEIGSSTRVITPPIQNSFYSSPYYLPVDTSDIDDDNSQNSLQNEPTVGSLRSNSIPIKTPEAPMTSSEMLIPKNQGEGEGEEEGEDDQNSKEESPFVFKSKTFSPPHEYMEHMRQIQLNNNSELSHSFFERPHKKFNVFTNYT